MVGFPPGGSGDFLTRLIADETSKVLGVAVIAPTTPSGSGSTRRPAHPVIVRRVHEAAAKGLAKPEVKEKIALQGMDATPSASPDAFEAELRAEAPMWEKIVRESGAKIE